MTTSQVHPLPTSQTRQTEYNANAPLSAKDQRRIFLRGLVLDANIGVYDHEIGRTQRINIDVDLYLDPPLQPINDDFRNVVDYDFIRSSAQDLIKDRHIKLQETLAEALADICLTHPGVTGVRVATSKLDIYDNCDCVGYEIIRYK